MRDDDDKDLKSSTHSDNPLRAYRWVGGLIILGLAIFLMVSAISGADDAPALFGMI